MPSLISYDYYAREFHFCQPTGGPKSQQESLGSILSGDRLYNSPFDIQMLKQESCQVLCKTVYPERDAQIINGRHLQSYAMHWLIDGLPAAKAQVQGDESVLSIGFDLGRADQQQQLQLNNHYNILIDYHERAPDDLRVVGVLVWPSSTSANAQGDCSDTSHPVTLTNKGDTEVTFTYSVTWRASETEWATRWDSILKIRDPKIHWFSLANSVICCLFLCAMVLGVLNKAVHKDTDAYNALDLGEDVQEDYGWKLVYGEVFRPPQRLFLLSVAVGTGWYVVAVILPAQKTSV